MPTIPTADPSKLRKLRETFLSQLPGQFADISERMRELAKGPVSQSEFEDIHRAIHTLKGSSAVFGLRQVSAVAQECENWVRTLQSGETPPGPDWASGMEVGLAALKEAIERGEIAQEIDTFGMDIAAAAEIHTSGERKVLYLCEDDPYQLSNLATQIGCFGFDVSPFIELERFHDAVRRQEPDLIVMDMVHPGNRTGGAQIVSRIRAEQKRKTPVVYISSEGDIGSRLAAVRAGCDAYFLKPVDPNELATTLHSLSSQEKPEPYRIMIVDDDARITALYQAILRGAGMETKAVTDPMLALDALAAFQPDLILMDMHMPGCNGMELAAVIRQFGEYLSIPIVFLSAETDENLQVDARRMGGDEFLLKSIRPDLLVSSVAARAQRMKLLRSHMVRDGLTGLYNHSSTKEFLEKAVGSAQRTGENVCFVMLDLDNFKGVNDRYGHPAGDRVLVALASLLRQRLRKTDVIGRFGGEEFAIILPGTSMPEAISLMNKLRQCFEAITFPCDGGGFNVTFSCGVASLTSHDNAEKLSLAADQALYRAKREGRNRVAAAGRFLSRSQLTELTVLLVEDAQPILAVMDVMLRGMGFATILHAAHGGQALEILRSRKIDLILADWHMPVLNGLDLLKAVRTDETLRAIPFVMITGENDRLSVREAVMAGVSEYILKPVLEDELSRKIIRVLCRREEQAPRT